MPAVLPLLLSLLAPAVAPAPAEAMAPAVAPAVAPSMPEPAPGGPPPERLAGRIQVTYLRPSSFSPAGMRYPLRKDVSAELRAARQAADAKPTDADALYRVAVLADQAEDPEAAAEWRAALGLIEAAVKAKPTDVLLERQVEALIGAQVALRALPAAEQFVAAKPDSWRARYLLGDAHLARADFQWRVLVNVARGTSALPADQVKQLNADLAAAEAAYGEALKLAPEQGAPRGARIALLLARPLMASFLPQGTLPVAEKPDLGPVWQDLMELLLRSPGSVAPLWHAAHCFANPPVAGAQPTPAEREFLEKRLAEATASGEELGFLEEARGLLKAALREWSSARGHFERAVAALPGRAFAAEWLALAETRTDEPRDAVIARLRARTGAANARSQDWAALGIVLAAESRPQAVEALRKALSLDPDCHAARYALGALFLREDPDSIEGRHHLRLVWQAEPDDREAQFAFLVLQALDGQEGPAARTLEELLRLEELEEDLRVRARETLADLTPPAKRQAR